MTSSNSTPYYVKNLEHATGLAMLMSFVSKHLHWGARLNIKDDIVYLEPQQSRSFLMGTVDGAPFLACYYDLLIQIKWQQAFVWQDHIYLLSERLKFNAFGVASIPAFTLAIAVDDLGKFSMWQNAQSLDIRRVYYQIESQEQWQNADGEVLDEDELEELDLSLPDNHHLAVKWGKAHVVRQDTPIQTINSQLAEQSVPLTFLTEENAHLIYSANAEKMAIAQRILTEQLNSKADEKMKMQVAKNGNLYQFYRINTDNNLAVYDDTNPQKQQVREAFSQPEVIKQLLNKQHAFEQAQAEHEKD